MREGKDAQGSATDDLPFQQSPKVRMVEKEALQHLGTLSSRVVVQNHLPAQKSNGTKVKVEKSIEKS